MSNRRGDFLSPEADHCTTVSSDLPELSRSSDAGAGFLGLRASERFNVGVDCSLGAGERVIVGTGRREVLWDQSTTVSLEASESIDSGDRTASGDLESVLFIELETSIRVAGCVE